MKKIDILYASDDNFAPILGTSLWSLYQANIENDLHVYIISQNIREENILKLKGISSHFRRNLIIIDQPDLEKTIGQKIDIQRYSLSMFSRLVADALLPNTVEKLIYLDCDTIIQQNILPLYESFLNGKTLGAVDDMRNFRYCRNLGMKKESHYINSGVLLMDLKRYRQLKIQAKMLEGMKKYNSYLEFPDNDLICMLLQDEIELLHPKYNVLSAMYMGNYKKCIQMRKPHLYYSEEIFCEALENPSIVHYTTCFAFVGRPWLQGCNHPQKKVFDECYNQTPWGNITYAAMDKNSRNCARKLYELLPENLGVLLIRFLHSWLKPNLQYFTMKRYKHIFKNHVV